MKVWFRFESDSHVTRRATRTKWDRNDTQTSWSAPDSIFLSKPSEWGYEEDEIFDESLKPGDILFMVWVQYSTGDSFGQDKGANHEVIGWYRDAKDAFKAKDAVEKRSKRGRRDDRGDSNSCRVPTYDGSGSRLQSCSGWIGYFESLDFCRVQTVMAE